MCGGIVKSFTCELFWILWFTEYIGYLLKERYRNKKMKPIIPIIITVVCSVIIFVIKEVNLLME